MQDKENIKTKSVNSIKKAAKEMLGCGCKETEIIECIVEAMFIGMVEAVPEDERLRYLVENKYVLKDFIKYVDIDSILSETIKTPDGIYTPEMLNYVVNLKINMKSEEKYLIFWIWEHMGAFTY